VLSSYVLSFFMHAIASVSLMLNGLHSLSAALCLRCITLLHNRQHS
jgi:hypothetical protein